MNILGTITILVLLRPGYPESLRFIELFLISARFFFCQRRVIGEHSSLHNAGLFFAAIFMGHIIIKVSTHSFQSIKSVSLDILDGLIILR